MTQKATNSSDDKARFEEQIKRYKPEFLKILEETDPTRIRPDMDFWSSIVQTLTAFALYDSSEKIENYSKWLKWLTVALVILTGVLAYLTSILKPK